MLIAMAIPTSSSFDLFDWSSSGVTLDDPTNGLGGVSTPSRSAPYVSFAGGVLQLVSRDEIPSAVSLGLNVPSTYTFEFRLRLTDIPENFDSPDRHRLFLGILDPAGGAAGVLISREGVSVVGDPSVPVSALGGSSGLVVFDDDLVFRVTVDSENKTASLYVTLASMVSSTGYILRHTLRLPASVSTIGTALFVEAAGSGASSVDVSISSLRLGSGEVLPNKRPMAVVGPDLAAPRQGLIQLDGSGSFDPEGEPLTFLWTIEKQPPGSSIALSNMTKASATFSGLTLTATSKGAQGNGLVVVITDPGMHQDNDTLLLSVNGQGQVAVTLRNETAAPSGKTTAEELVRAITVPTDSSYSVDVAALITAEITGDPYTLVAAVTTELLGGADSSDESPVFYAQAPGTYEFSLVVNDGELSSTPSLMVVACLESAVEIGRIPDPSYIWKYLPDFLGMISDKKVFESIWRAMIQLVGAEMLRLWQVDRNKSLRDIQPKMQHKWVAYPAVVTPSGSLDLKGPSAKIAAVPLDDFDGDLTTTSLRTFASADLSVYDKVVVYTGGTSSLLTVVDNRPWRMGTTGSITAGSQYLTVASGLGQCGVVENDPVFVTLGSGQVIRLTAKNRSTDTVLVLKDVPLVSESGVAVQIGGVLTVEEDSVDCYQLIDSGVGCGRAADDGGDPELTALFDTTFGAFSSSILSGDLLIVGDSDVAFALEISSRSSTRLTLSSASLPSSVRNESWKVVRSVVESPVSLQRLPFFVSSDDALEAVNPSDLVRLEDASRTIYGYVEAVSTTAFAIGGLSDFGGSGDLVSVLRTTEIPTPEDTVGVPRLQTYGGSEEYLQLGIDYEIVDQKIRFTRKNLSVDHYAGSSRVLVTDGGVSVSSGYLRFPDGPDGGLFKVTGSSGLAIDLAHVFASSGSSVSAEHITFTEETIPDVWWAEYTYVDNWRAVENNFGLLVGMTMEDFSDISGGSYLSSVKALHFALWNGPTVSNLALGAQVFFNLPFSEAAGVISDINERATDTHGRILITDLDVSAATRSYYYPLAAGIAVNPNTDAVYAAGDVVTAFAPLSKGVVVSDYINDPQSLDLHLTGVNALKKFHTFKVEVDLDAVEGSEVFSLVSRYMDRAKPQYTDYILVGKRGLSDAIDVTVKTTAVITPTILEGLYTTPDGAIFSGSAVSAGATTLVGGSDLPAVEGLYAGMLLRITDGAGSVQTVPILSYTGYSRTFTVAGWGDVGTPDGTSSYQVVNPPPFHSGFFPSLDFYDGKGSWDRDSSTIQDPFGGEPPTAIIIGNAPDAPFVYGEPVRGYGGGLIGTYMDGDGVSTPMRIRVDGGSVPYPGDSIHGDISGGGLDINSASLGAWPSYSYINRERSEIWVPLVADSSVGPAAPGLSDSLDAVSGSVATLGSTASSEDHSYVNWMLLTGIEVRRIVSYEGATKQATLTSAFDFATIGTSYSLCPPRHIAALLGLPFFAVGSWVTGLTSGHRAQVHYHGPSYLRLVNSTHNPYESFSRGEYLSGENSEFAVAVDGVFYVTPDYLNKADRVSQESPSSRVDHRICFYIGEDGEDPGTGLSPRDGLVLGDMELYQKPYDPLVADDEQIVPSFGPGLYWWEGYLLTYNYQDPTPTGPQSGKVWLPSPEVPVGTLHTDPAWNSNVLHDTIICRSLAANDRYAPSLGASAVPDPIITSIT